MFKKPLVVDKSWLLGCQFSIKRLSDSALFIKGDADIGVGDRCYTCNHLYEEHYMYGYDGVKGKRMCSLLECSCENLEPRSFINAVKEVLDEEGEGL